MPVASSSGYRISKYIDELIQQKFLACLSCVNANEDSSILKKV